MYVRTSITLAEPTDLQKNISKQTNKQNQSNPGPRTLPPGSQGVGEGMKARSPYFPSLVLVREKGGHIGWPAERRGTGSSAHVTTYITVYNPGRSHCTGKKPIGLSRVLPKAKDYPSLFGTFWNPAGPGPQELIEGEPGPREGLGARYARDASGHLPGESVPRDGVKQRRGIRGRFPGPPPPRTPQSSVVPAGGSRTRFSRGLPAVAELLGTGRLLKRSDCPRQPRPAGPQRGQPASPILLRT